MVYVMKNMENINDKIVIYQTDDGNTAIDL